MMMNKSILYFLLGIVSTLVVEGIAIFIMLYDPSPGHIEVSENDWNDNWEKEFNVRDSTNILYYSDKIFSRTNRYIIENFYNSPFITKMIISSSDSIKYNSKKDFFSWVFLWNDKYNHPWRVEYVDQKYVNEISSLFGLTFTQIPEYKRKIFFANLYLFPSLSKKHTSPVTIERVNKRNNTIYLRTDYKNGFDFFLWKDLQDYTKLLSKKGNHKGRYTLLERSSGKELATIEWFGEGYKLRLPKDENRSRK